MVKNKTSKTKMTSRTSRKTDMCKLDDADMSKLHFKSLFLCAILVFFLLFSGCSLVDDAKGDGFKIGGGTSSKGGSGVELSFPEGRPSSEMIKGKPSTFVFILKNYQEHTIEDLKIRTSGYDAGYVKGFDTDYPIPKIPRATEQTGPGVYTGNPIKGVIVDNFKGKYDFNPTFDYCYTAITTSNEQVCVPSKEKNVCDIDYEKSKSQNGPLSVTIDRITAIENTVRIDYTVKNTGNGKIVNKCFETEDYANEYTLKASLGSTQGTCKSISEKFEVINSESKFYCEFPRSGDAAYPSQALVELTYNYQQTVQKRITVKDLNQGYE